MKEIALPAVEREVGTKGKARRVRMAGSIPAVVYGPETEPYAVSVAERDLRSAMKSAGGASSIFDLAAGSHTNKVIIREVQRDPITSKVVHIDFHAISMSKPIHISVPIRFIGTPVGVKTDGGIMQTTMRELRVACLPTNIPDRVDVDVSELGIGDAVHVRDLNVPNVEILNELQRTVVVISAPTVSKIDEAAAAAAAAAAAEGGEAAAAAEGEKKEEGDKKE